MTSTIRVALVSHYFSTHRGGVEQVAGELARRLASLGRFQLTWVSSAIGDPPASVDRLNTVPVRANNSLERLGFPWPVWPLASLRTLNRVVANSDIVHLHDFIYFGNTAAYFFARSHRKPIIVTQHIGDIPYKNPALRVAVWTINRTLGRMVLAGADRAAFISDAVRQQFEQFVSFRKPPLHVPNGVDTNTFRPTDAAGRDAVRIDLGVAPEAAIVLYVGRFVDKKGLPLLRRLASAMPEIEWWFAGWGAPGSNAHPATWKFRNVRVFENRSGATLADLYRAADLLVLPSMSEGFPLVVQEAMACGTRALVTNTIAGGAPQTGELLLTCPIEPPEQALEEWQKAIRSALATRDHALQGRLVDFATANWTWERTVDRYAELFDELAVKRQEVVKGLS